MFQPPDPVVCASLLSSIFSGVLTLTKYSARAAHFWVQRTRHKTIQIAVIRRAIILLSVACESKFQPAKQKKSKRCPAGKTSLNQSWCQLCSQRSLRVILYTSLALRHLLRNSSTHNPMVRFPSRRHHNGEKARMCSSRLSGSRKQTLSKAPLAVHIAHRKDATAVQRGKATVFSLYLGAQRSKSAGAMESAGSGTRPRRAEAATGSITKKRARTNTLASRRCARRPIAEPRVLATRTTNSNAPRSERLQWLIHASMLWDRRDYGIAEH